MEYLIVIANKKVRVFCDYHGHSRQKNVFMYGCDPNQSWWPEDIHLHDKQEFAVSKFIYVSSNYYNFTIIIYFLI